MTDIARGVQILAGIGIAYIGGSGIQSAFSVAPLSWQTALVALLGGGGLIGCGLLLVFWALFAWEEPPSR